MGKVYVFNPSTSPVQYTVNFGNTPFAQPAKNNYTPNFVVIQRQVTISTGVFGFGINTFSSFFQDVGPGEPTIYNFNIEILNNYSLLDDIIIYCFRTLLFVMSPQGFPVSPQGSLIYPQSSA